ncbi:DUF58 domain-containing protein [Sulfurirhabdus autotrophica]|uniref:Uncharacterized protein DUF58 n=1 Tax=Sulfurirhabdus autotrophica TaxID=1706046 RepID=A0A4R3XTT0_9PROT|nr:DUF58 domain-containing protein [Sulfurirhabdus autotrophica]TCV82530.1 uncharacterized protein DUF58 [Sulfurirhabdus autotrophica]
MKIPGSLFKRLISPVSPAENDGIHSPLLGDDELAEIIRRVQAMNLAQGQSREVHYRHAGNYRSAYLGRGLDFEEVRPYQHGDEVRDMDWRTTARTGKPYLKIYREEHQPALHIVVDRGASMRFGTRVQLKATLAARIAAIFAFSAMSSNACIGGTVWQPGGFTLPCRNGEEGATWLVRAAISPCPPLLEESQEEARTFTAMLRHLDTLLTRGTRLFLISDFSQLHEQDLPVLLRLASHHDLIVVQVLDAAEEKLPDVGLMRFHDVASGKLRWLDTANHGVREIFQREAAALHDKQRMLFERIGVRLHQCTTDSDPFSLITRISYE